MSLTWDPGRWGDPRIEAAADRVLRGGLRSARSAIDPDVSAWSAETVADLRQRIIDEADSGAGTFVQKLEQQLATAQPATFLLCAELLFLQVVPLSNVGADAKQGRIGTVLAWSGQPYRLPGDMNDALAAEGVFNGGIGFLVQIWRQMGWLLAFVEHWWQQPNDRRAQALEDPWEFRQLVADMDKDQPGIRNSLLFLAYPRVFFPIVNQQHKRDIRDAFSSIIGGTSGNDAASIDRDLVTIRARQLEAAGGAPVNYYFEPYLSQWWKQGSGTDRRAWLVRPRGGGTALVQQWLSEGSISIPATHLGDVPTGADRPTVLAAVDAAYQHLDYVQRVALANEFHTFISRMQPDDVVATYVEGTLWVGAIVEGSAHARREGALHRDVVWNPEPIGADGLSASVTDGLDKQGDVVDLTESVGELAELLGDGDDDAGALVTPVPIPDGSLQLRPADAGLAGRLHLEQAWLQEVVELLEDRQQIVLYGPPGTGKTYVADAVARHLTDGDAVRLVQFHPSYSYEDFFEGFRPALEGRNVGFRLTAGPLRRLAADAALNPTMPHILIIDEINRANLAKVFGELYYLLEYRRKKIYLQYSPQEEFTLPPNVFFIGTMNTADKSIALVDAAIRRRFAFVEMHPEEEPVRGLLERWLTATGRDGDDRAALLQALNAAMGDRDRDFKVGPSYLMKADADREGGLERVWRYSIMPLLQEHFYGRPEAERLDELFGLPALRAQLAAGAPSAEAAAAPEDPAEGAEPS